MANRQRVPADNADLTRKCGAKKGNGFLCKLPAGYRTPHPGWGSCLHHGGCTPSGKSSAAKERANGLIDFYGAPINTNPIDALLDEVKRTAGHVAWLGKKVSGWKTEVDDDGTMPNGLKDWADRYLAERKHLVFVSKAALDAGINERLVQIAEHQGMRLADAVEKILYALHLTPEQRLLIPSVVPKILRGLSSPAMIVDGEVVS